MADNFGLKIGVDGEKEFKAALRDINSQFKVLGSEMNLVSSQFDKNDKSVQALAARNSVLNKEIDAQKEKISLLKDALANASESFGDNDRRTQAWAMQLNNAQAELNGMERELGKNNDALDEAADGFDDAEKETGEFEDALEDASKTADDSGGRFEKLGGILKGVGAALAAGVAAIGAAVGVAASKINDCVNVYADFEDSMLQVAATMGISAAEIAEGSEAYEMLEKAAKDAGASTRFTASESAEALNYLALAGYDAAKACEVLPDVLDLAAAGDMSLATASDLVTDAMSALNMETDDLTMFIDQMAKTAQSSNTSVQQLGEGILICAGTAESTGQELTTLNASLGVMADNGIKGAEGGTHLRNVLLSLSAPTDKAKKQLDDLGVSVYDNEGNMRQLDDVMADLNGSLSELSQEERTNALYNIFNKTDLNSVNALLGATSGRFDELSGAIDDSAGAAAAMAETMESGLAGATRSFNSAVEGMQIEVGSLFAGMKEGIMRDSTDIIRTFTGNLAEANGDWGKIAEAMGTALADIINLIAERLPQIVDMAIQIISMLGGALIDNLPTIVSAATDIILALLEGLISALPALTEGAIQLVLALVTGLLDNLPALIEAALAMVAALVQGLGEALPQLIPAIVEAVVLICQTLIENLPLILEAALQLILGLAEGLLAAIPELVAALPEIIMAIVDFVIEAIPQIVEAGIALLTSLVEALPEIIEAIVAAIPEIINNVLDAIIGSIPMLIQAGVDLLIALVQALPQIITTIVAAIPQIISGIVDALIGNIDKIIMAGVQLLVALIENLPTIIIEIVKAVPQIIAGLVEAIVSFVPELAQAGLNLIQGLWNGISDAGAWLWDKISGFFGGIMDRIKGFFGIASPSKLFAELGGFMGEGLGLGFEEAMDDVGEDMQNAIPTSFDMPGLDIGGGINSAIHGGSVVSLADLGGKLDTVADLMADMLPSMLEALNIRVVLDDGTLVGKLAPEIDRSLGLLRRQRAIVG